MNTNLTTLLSIDGMTCGSCKRRVQAILLAQDHVLGADVRVREQGATLLHDAPLDLTRLSRELAEHGYTARVAPAAANPS